MQKRYLATGILAISALVGVSACGYDYGGNEEIRFNETEVKVGAGDLDGLNKDDDKKEGKADDKKAEPAKVDVKGDKVTNIREEVAPNAKTFCDDSKLEPGEGKADKGNTCVSTQLGEIAANPVLIAMPGFPDVVAENKSFAVKIQIEDKFGPLDLNAFTHDENNKAGDTFLEHPSELDNDGRPLLHAHFGVTTLKEDKGLPKTNDYDAAFSGVQGVKGDKGLSVTVSGLPAGFYRADVYAGGPGHAPNPTAKATQVQAFSSVYFEVK